MRLFVRILMIWFLVLAVPAQAAAAATMAFCGPNHHGGAAGQMQAVMVAEHAHHDVNAATDHMHDHAADPADEDSSDAPASMAPAKVGDASKHTCSACASCCSVGAILSSVLTVPAPDFTPTVFSALVASVDTFAADGPDRPPRLVLA